MGQFSIALIGIVLVAAVTADQAAWNSFKIRHRKSYKNVAEERTRMKIFMDNLKEIVEHNVLFEIGAVSYEKGLNKFSDMSHDEFHSAMNGYGSSNDDNNTYIQFLRKILNKPGLTSDDINNRPTHKTPDDDKIPESIDWRTKGAVTAVREQKNCVACWAFASCGALEGAHFIKTGNLIPLSEQNLVDCMRPDEKQCYFGNYRGAFDYIRSNGGIDTYDSYPFKVEKDKCNYDPKKNSGVTVNSYVPISTGDEDELTHAIATIGPIVVAIDSSLIHDYKGGIFNDPKCSQKMCHEVLVVGYGTDKKDGDYYIIKNSYGTSWGEDGYMKMARNKGNLCGIANDAGYPKI